MSTTLPDVSSLHDRLDIVDALYRFAAGQDRAQRDTFLSAFADDATLDFTQPAQRFGASVPVMHGRAAIEQILTSVADLDTTHTVTNPRIVLDGDTAHLEALVEAQHVTRESAPRQFLLKNLYDVELVRDGAGWVILHMAIRTVWWTGEPEVLFGVADSSHDDG